MPIESRPLVSCRRCAVTVHAECYPVNRALLESMNAEQDASSSSTGEDSPAKKRRIERGSGWMCRRCEFSREELVCASLACELCPLRSGALIRHNPSLGCEFVHVTCAIMSRRTKIVREKDGDEMYAVSLPQNWTSTMMTSATPPW